MVLISPHSCNPNVCGCGGLIHHKVVAPSTMLDRVD